MNRTKFHVKKGDLIQVISGNHKGSTGKILEILRKKERAVIEGVHMIKKHVRKSQEYPNGGIVEREGTIHISNLKLIEAKPDEKKPAKASKKKEATKAS